MSYFVGLPYYPQLYSSLSTQTHFWQVTREGSAVIFWISHVSPIGENVCCMSFSLKWVLNRFVPGVATLFGLLFSVK